MIVLVSRCAADHVLRATGGPEQAKKFLNAVMARHRATSANAPAGADILTLLEEPHLWVQSTKGTGVARITSPTEDRRVSSNTQN